MHGTGGVGKTQVALQFAEKHESRYQHIFWLDGSNNETRELGYKNIMSQIDSNFDPNGSVQTALETLERYECNWLLLFDGANDIEDLDALKLP